MRSTYYGRPIPEYAYSTIVYKDGNNDEINIILQYV